MSNQPGYTNPVTGLNVVTGISQRVDGVVSTQEQQAQQQADDHTTIGVLQQEANTFSSEIFTLATTKANESEVTALTATVATKAAASDLTALATTVATKAAASDVTALSATVTGHTASIATLSTKAAGSDLTALTTVVATKAAASDVTALTSTVAGHTTSIATLTTNATALSTTVGTKAAASDLTALTTTVGTKATASDVTALTSTVTGHTTSIATLTTNATALSTTVGTKAAASDLTALTTTVGTKALASDVTALTSTVSGHTTSIATLTTNATALSTTVGTKAAASDLATLSSTVGTKAAASDVTALTSTVAGHTASIATLTTNATALATTVGTKAAASDVATLSSTVAAQATSIASLNTSVSTISLTPGPAGPAGAVGAQGAAGAAGSVGPAGPAGVFNASSYPLANASFTGSAAFTGSSTFNGDLTLKGSTSLFKLQNVGSMAGISATDTMILAAANDGSLSIAGPFYGNSSATITGLLTGLSGMTMSGPSTFDSLWVQPSSSSAYASLNAAANMTGYLDFNQQGLTGVQGRISYYQPVMSFYGSGSERMRMTSTGLSIGTTVSESSLIAAGTRALYATATGVHAGTISSSACLALASTGFSGSWIDFTTAGASTLLGRIQYSPSGANMQHIVGGVEQMRLTSGGVAIGATQSPTESSLIVSGTRISYPTVAGVHSGLIGGTNGSISLASTTGGASFVDFQTVGQSASQGRLSYYPGTSTFSFNSGANIPLTLVGANVGCGTTSPIASLQVAGLMGTTVTTGVSMGMSNGSPSNAVLCLTSATNSNNCYIGFTSSGQTYSANGMISYSNNTNIMSFSTLLGVQLTLNGTTVLMGTVVAQPSYKLYVNGSSYATTVAGGTKPFDIPHQSKPGHRLRHRVIESPQAGLMYSYQLDCSLGANTVQLPEWYSWLACEPTVHITPFKCFGIGWGEVDAAGSTLTVHANQAGTYNVMLWATRADDQAVAEFNEFGVEYRQNA